MNEIEKILDNIDQYANNIDALYRALKERGINDFEQFWAAAQENGTPVTKAIRDALADKFANSEEEDWNRATLLNTEEAYIEYMNAYPDGAHCNEAREGISSLQKQRENIAWDRAKSLNTEEAYKEYMNAYPEGVHRDEAREKISLLQKQRENIESEKAWNSLDKSSIDALQSFIKQYPQSKYKSEASKILNDLIRGVDIRALAKKIKSIKTDSKINDPETAIFNEIVNYISTRRISVDDLLSAIKDDNNFISGAVANKLWEAGIITDFSNTGIGGDFIAQMMANMRPQGFAPPEPIDRITKSPCTEVYFWGIPSSGKTCALGAILSAANSGHIAKNMQHDPDCQGYGYMTDLANLFRTDGSIGILPEGTPISSTYEMGFILEDDKHKEHPITFIDLAGEVIRCMHKKIARKPLAAEEENVLNTLTNILVGNRTSNRKMHFFVIEYGAEDREYERLPQMVYLQSAVAYIRQTKIFEKDTDRIYLLITKVDKVHVVGEDLRRELIDYINNNYLSFYNGLKSICRKNEINNGDVEIQPFSLGTVCFQNYCKFKKDYADAVVHTILERSYGYKPGKLQEIIDKLKK